MAHGDAREGKWRGNWRMEWVTSTLHTTSEHGVFSIITADAHTSAASSRLNWHPRRFKWTRSFRGKTKYDFCTCAIKFQTQSARAREQVILKFSRTEAWSKSDKGTEKRENARRMHGQTDVTSRYLIYTYVLQVSRHDDPVVECVRIPAGRGERILGPNQYTWILVTMIWYDMIYDTIWYI
jgi:hypothetical protein